MPHLSRHRSGLRVRRQRRGRRTGPFVNNTTITQALPIFGDSQGPRRVLGEAPCWVKRESEDVGEVDKRFRSSPVRLSISALLWEAAQLGTQEHLSRLALKRVTESPFDPDKVSELRQQIVENLKKHGWDPDDNIVWSCRCGGVCWGRFWAQPRTPILKASRPWCPGSMLSCPIFPSFSSGRPSGSYGLRGAARGLRHDVR